MYRLPKISFILDINNTADEVTLCLYATGGYLSTSTSGSAAADTKMGFKTLLEVDNSNFVPRYILPDGEKTSASSATAEKKKKTSTSDSTSYTKGSSSR